MQAFILAAGFGKRMGEQTQNIPKPLLRVNGYPLLCYSLFTLYRWGVTDAVVNLHYHGNKIRKYLSSFPHFRVLFSEENEILGTAGGLRKALNKMDFDRNLIMINSDVILFPDHLDFPWSENEPSIGENEAVLFLNKRQSESFETGWKLNAECPRRKSDQEFPIAFDPENGPYYYMGYSIQRPRAYMMLEENRFAELGPIWKEHGEKCVIAGRLYKGISYEIGNREQYLRHRDRNIIPAELGGLWKTFVEPWDARGTNTFGSDIT